jgi:putative glycerol-1-phosphate prenyltransferase
MRRIYKDILSSIAEDKKLMAVLIDPDKMKIEDVSDFICKVNRSIATHIFVGGSEVEQGITEKLVIEIKTWTALPVILFPGDVSQITQKADALLFLSLISGRNPEYLIGKHVEAASELIHGIIEIIPTGYILIESDKETAVQRVTETQPMSVLKIKEIVHTAKAGELLGMKFVYLEAGSGALRPISAKIIKHVKAVLDIPLIVGGGIRNISQLENAYDAGADLVVIGTAFEENETLINKLMKETN